MIDEEMTARVLIADDDASIRDALRELLESEGGIEVVAVTEDADTAIEAATREHPDVAILDVKMPGGGGPQAARGILARSPGTRIVALSAYGDRASILEMLRAGASAYLVKGSMPDEVTRTIQRVLLGESAFSAEVASTVVHELTEQLAGREEAELTRDRVLARIRSVTERGDVHPVYQPIVDLAQGRVSGVEALSRFDSGTPQQWFDDADAVGLRAELETAAIRAALCGLPSLPPGAYLSLNISPATLQSRDIARLLDTVPLDRVVMEMTEHAAVSDYDALKRALRPLRQAGVRIAVDDAGAGFASLRHILLLAPEIIKLDISLTRGIDSDRPRRALSFALVAFARETQSTIVAEGVETGAELRVLRDLGVTHGQGFLLARPSALPVDERAIQRALGGA
jgi:EAL domain-containing protein (putative c-di-GMP-specific phosphodiesterase class I)/ActR/RegA family two-component response regulator